MVAIGGIADIVQHWHEMARSRMTQSGHGTWLGPLVAFPFRGTAFIDSLTFLKALF